MVRWLSGYETRLLLRAGIKSPISVGLKQPEAGKGVPAAHPYSVGIGCCLFDRLEKVVVDQAENIVVFISSTETAFFNRMDGVQGGTGGSGGILSVAKA